MMNPTLQSALNDCLDRLADGQTIEQCVATYPKLADQLRPLLEIGQSTSRLRADNTELLQMHQRLDPKIESLIADTNFNQRPPIGFPRGSLVLIASLIILVIGVGIIFGGDNTITGEQPTETPTITVTETQATPSPTLTQITPSVTQVIPSPTLTQITPLVTQITPSPLPDTSLCTPPNYWVEYRVVAGDTLSFIAVNAGATLDELRSANCLDASNLIIEGQILFVPKLWQQSTNSGESNNNLNTNNDDDSDDSDDDDSDDDDSDDDDSDDDSDDD